MGATIEGITFNGDDAYQRVSYRGVTLNKRTAAAVIQAQRLFGRQFDAIPQGSYHSGTSQSAGTHDGGGAIDIYDSHLDDVQRVMRRVGFASWHRTTLPGEWNAHCHSIMLGDKETSSGADAQIPDYSNYRDGLASHAADNTWHPFPKGAKPKPLFDYPKWVKEQEMQQDDKLQAGKPGTVGEALGRANHIDEFRTAVGDRFDKTNASLGEAKDAIKAQAADIDEIGADVNKLSEKVDKIRDDLKEALDLLKAQG